MRMRRMLRLWVLGALLSCLAAAGAQAAEPHWGTLYVLSGTVSVRENPSDSALQVRMLKAGQKVRVDFQDDGWAAVFDPKESARSELRAMGYAKLAELKAHSSTELAQVRSIEVRKPAPDAKPEVLVDGKPVKAGTKPNAKPGAKVASKGAAAKGFGELRVADRQLTVRAMRDKESAFRRMLKPGQRVRVDFLEDGWFAVFDPDEKSRDLKNAWGYSRDKYLVPESAYSGPPDTAIAPNSAPAQRVPGPAASSSATATPKGQKLNPDEEAVGYAVMERKSDRHKPPVTTLRVRLDFTKPPAQEVMRKITREVWKAEHKKNEPLQLEIFLTGMDPHGLAYAVAKFHDDGRIKEFWWRDVVMNKGKK